MQNALEPTECPRIQVQKIANIEIRKGEPKNSDILQNCFPPEIRSPPLICRNFKTLIKVLQNHAECNEI